MINNWFIFLGKKRNLNETIFTISLFALISFIFSWFLTWVEDETRTPFLGYFNDPLFFWDPIDFSIPILYYISFSLPIKNNTLYTNAYFYCVLSYYFFNINSI